MPSLIKYIVDHYHIKLIVAGSSSFYLKNLFTESLSGRGIIYNLRPLDLVIDKETAIEVKVFGDLHDYGKTKALAKSLGAQELSGFFQASPAESG